MAVINRFPIGGGIPDDLTADPSVVASGYKFVGGSTDEIETGTLQLSGNAKTNHVLKNNTFYDTDLKIKRTGIMEVANVANLILGLSSGRIITVKWTNPVTTSGRPYSGVYVRYQTGSYPTPTTGTQAYKGVGSSSASGVQSTITLTMPNLSTTYYFIVYSYCITSNGELLGTQLKGTIVTGNSQVVTITSSKNYTIPAGYNLVDIFCVGGGGGGGRGQDGTSTTAGYGGGGGGGGYTKTVKNIAVSTGQVLSCVIGDGGYANSASGIRNGGTSSVSRSGTVLCSADGGVSPTYKGYTGQKGGSGGGKGGANNSSNFHFSGGIGGSDGAEGGANNKTTGGGAGQGTTTRAFGESSGALYSGGGGGGGGGAWGSSSVYNGGVGGNRGGGTGGTGSSGSGGSSGAAGGANTGGGGGGGGGGSRTSSSTGRTEGMGGLGGTGVILIRLK